MPIRPLVRALTSAFAALALAAPIASAHVVLPGETLSGIAAANGLSTATLAAANGISPDAWVVSGTSLTVPAPGTAPVAPATPALATSAAAAGGDGHLVLPGETLSGIAAANGLSTSSLAAANGLGTTSFVIAGTRLHVPAAGSGTASTVSGAPAPSGASSGGSGGGHLVLVGETLSGIAAANGLSTGSLAAANGMSPESFVIAGTRLRIPAPGVGTTTAGATTTATPIGGYRVRLGDTLGKIAAEHGVGMSTLASANGLDPANVLLAGSFLRLPAPGSAPSTTAAAPVTSAGSTPIATGGRMTSDQIASIAAQHGVPGSLAAAIAWQESGFNNSMVSVANARGIMQVLPSTWDYVESSLANGQLDPSSPTDNVRAGSLLLGQLLRDTGGDPAMAAAAYYQGLGSVRRIGLLPETQKYVANVMALRSRFGG